MGRKPWLDPLGALNEPLVGVLHVVSTIARRPTRSAGLGTPRFSGSRAGGQLLSCFGRSASDIVEACRRARTASRHPRTATAVGDPGPLERDRRAEERDRRAEERDRRGFILTVLSTTATVLSIIIAAVGTFWRLPTPQPQQAQDVTFSASGRHNVRGGGNVNVQVAASAHADTSVSAEVVPAAEPPQVFTFGKSRFDGPDTLG